MLLNYMQPLAHSMAVDTLQRAAQPSPALVPTGMPRSSNGGGTNAQGSPTPFGQFGQGMFQYGQGQYGQLGPGGTINWNVAQNAWNKWLQGHAGHALDANAILHAAAVNHITHPTSHARAPYYLDDVYATQMVGPEMDNKQMQAQGASKLKSLASAFTDWLDSTQQSSGLQRQQLSSSLAGRGFDPGFGAGAGDVLDFNQQLQDLISQKTRENATDVRGTKLDMSMSNQRYNQTKATQQLEAKHRYELQGKTPPKLQNGFYKQGGQWYYTNPKTGVTITVAHGPKGH